MSDERHDELGDGEREALRSLGRTPPAPPALEDRTVRALRERGLLAASAAPSRTGRRVAAGLLAAAALYVLGMATGWRLAAPWAQGGPAPAEGSEFMLLLHQSSGEVGALSQEEHERRVGEYVAWARRLAENGSLVDGNELGDDGRLLTGSPASLDVTEGVRSFGSMVVGGYFLIRARDYADAVRTARDCPHLKYGGEIEIRRINHT